MTGIRGAGGHKSLTNCHNTLLPISPCLCSSSVRVLGHCSTSTTNIPSHLKRLQVLQPPIPHIRGLTMSPNTPAAVAKGSPGPEAANGRLTTQPSSPISEPLSAAVEMTSWAAATW